MMYFEDRLVQVILNANGDGYDKHSCEYTAFILINQEKTAIRTCVCEYSDLTEYIRNGWDVLTESSGEDLAYARWDLINKKVNKNKESINEQFLKIIRGESEQTLDELIEPYFED